VIRRKFYVLLAVVAILAAAVSSVYAVVWGEEDGDAHPYVGLLIFDVNGTPAWRCSGTLISSTVVLTAGHCTSGATGARIWFDSDLTGNTEYPFGGATSVEGTPYAHPAYDGFATFPNTSDVGVVVLAEAVTDVGYGALPVAGAVDDLYYNRPPGPSPLMNIVGYGLQSVVPDLQAERVRYQGNPQIVELNSAYTSGWNIHLGSNNGKGQGQGGACFGDSGGPALLSSESNVVGGVGSFVLNGNCVGAGYYYRVDTAHALDWVNTFLD
jgi:hypothetical protein